jgi:two-component system, sensor histidine kinase and response regulator
VSLDLVTNGALAVESILKRPENYYEAILMDLQMPVMGGIDATSKIRNFYPNIPIIAMTAHAMIEEKQRCLQVGMNDHVTKPVEPKLLYAALARWIKPKTEQSQERTQSSQVNDDTFPEQLLPFNIPAALLRVNGKKKLLRKLIVGFYSDYQDVLERLQTVERADAKRLVHSLKGIALTLEIADLPLAASKLEKALQDNSETIPQDVFDALEAALEPALRAASELALNIVENPERVRIAIQSNQDELIEELESLLAINNLKARKCFQQINGTLLINIDSKLSELLSQQINSLDFAGARKTLQQLKQSMLTVGDAL